MNYNLLTSSDLNAAQITSEVTEQVVTKTNRWISFWNEHVPDLISFGANPNFPFLTTVLSYRIALLCISVR